MLPKLGRYEPIRKIAAGGMATVYLGRVVGEGGFERLVALKVMHAHIASDPDFVAMFLDEARLAARIRHNNVVSTIDIQKTEEAMFLVMEYVDGPTLQELRKHLKACGARVPVGVAVRVFVDILGGLHEAHELGDKDGQPLNLIHRDVSPHNILIGRDGVAKLTDFGVARAEARLSMTRGGQLKGKIAYMAPEQIVGEPIDRRGDIYSAAVCLWEALAGKRLYRAPNDGALVHEVLQGKPERPSAHQEVPAPIENVVMRALSRKRDERFADALEMLEALEAAARDAGVALPGNREVGKFIQQIASELERAPVQHAKTVTPPSGAVVAPQQMPRAAGRKRSALWGGLGARNASSRPPASTAAAVALDVHRDELSASRPLSTKTQRGLGAPPQSSSQPRLPPPTPIRGVDRPEDPPPAMPEFALDAEDTGPSAGTPQPQSQDLSQPSLPSGVHGLSQPSVVTQPTQTEAIYSLQPPASRNGVVAVIVAGVILVGVILAVVLGSPSGTNEVTPSMYPTPTPSVEPTASATSDATAATATASTELPPPPTATASATATADGTAAATASAQPRIPYRKQREDIYEP